MKGILAALVGAMMLQPAMAARKDPEAALADTLKDRVAGPPQQCIELSLSHGVEIVPGIGLIYRLGASKLYLNRVDGADRLDPDDLLISSSSGSMLCRLDRVQLVARTGGFVRNFVVLRDFVPYTRR